MAQRLSNLTATFPTALRGYERIAVDDFIRQMGDRLDELQNHLTEQTERAERLSKELAATKKELAAFAEKESAIASALVATEQRRAAVEKEIEAQQALARTQAEEILAAAQSQADAMIAEAEENVKQITARGELACSLQEDRLRALLTEYEETAERIRRILEAQLALLPSSAARESDLPVSHATVNPAAQGEYIGTA